MRSEMPAKSLRVLVASSDPDKIVMVRQSLDAWPTETICRVAASWEDAVLQVNSDAPDILCWDSALGQEPPMPARDLSILLLGHDGCELLRHGSEVPPVVTKALGAAVSREYHLRRLELQLRAVQGTEMRMRALLVQASDGIVVLDTAGVVVFANAAAARLCGHEGGEWVGTRFEHPIPAAGEAAICSISLGTVHRRLSITAAPTVWDAQEAVVLLLQQIGTSASVPAMDHVRDQADRLRAIGRLAAGVAHEVNNPLTFVLANLESLRESCHTIHRFVRKLDVALDPETEGDIARVRELSQEYAIREVVEDAADMLTDCNKGMNRIQDIARSLGTFSRADEDEAELVDISRVVDDACAMVFNQIRYRARLVKRFESTPTVAAYPGRIAQALVNMLVNAAESIRGGKYNDHRIVVATYVREEEISISVTDTGEGVPAKDREHIFVPGYTTRADEGAMGLGLTLCSKVADEHGGRVEVHPLEGQGTRFELIIPCDTGLSVRVQRRDSRPPSEMPFQGQRLLIVDDDAMVLSALRRRLQRRYEVVTVLGGVEALALLSEDPDFDAIICDLMMPEVDGKSFYEAVSTDHPALLGKTVFMSGGAFTPRLRKFAASISNIVLQKPVSRDRLDEVLRSLDTRP